MNSATVHGGSYKAGLTVASGAIFDIWDGDSTVDEVNGSGTIREGMGGDNTLTIGSNGGNGNFRRAITNTSGTLSLVKQGNGTQTLSGANTHRGQATITAGTLFMTNSTGSATGSVGVSSGTTLGGPGRIAGAVNVSTGGFVSLGSSPGNFTLRSGLTLGGTYAWELSTLSTASPGTNFDTITITGGRSRPHGCYAGLESRSQRHKQYPFLAEQPDMKWNHQQHRCWNAGRCLRSD